jgi:hypothetical protein
MIEESLKYPLKDEERVKKMLLGSLLTLSSVLIIPAFTALGYLMRTMREDSMPEFNNLLEMTKEGFQGMAIYSFYVIVSFGIFIPFESSQISLLATPLLLLVAYSMYSLFYQISNNGWKAGFSTKVLKDAFTLNYFLAYLSFIVIGTAISVAYLLTTILVIPILLFPAFYFYLYIFAFRLFTEAINSE